MPLTPGIGAANSSEVPVEALRPVLLPMVHVVSVSSQIEPPAEVHPPPQPALCPAIAAGALVPGVRRFKEVVTNVFHVCNANPH